MKVIQTAIHRKAHECLIIIVQVSFKDSGAALGHGIIYKRLSCHLGGSVNHSWHGNDTTLFRRHYVAPFTPQCPDRLNIACMGTMHIHLANRVFVGDYRSVDVCAKVDFVRLYDSLDPLADAVRIGRAGISRHPDARRCETGRQFPARRAMVAFALSAWGFTAVLVDLVLFDKAFLSRDIDLMIVI